MADNDLTLYDQSTPPAAFKPETTDQGSFVRRTMVGLKDGADVARGARADAAWDGVAASASEISILKRIATTALSPALPAGAATDAGLAALRTAVGTPLQAGSPVVANLGTIAGVSTEATLVAVKAAVQSPALPAGAATDSTLVAIKNALLAQLDLATLFLTDGGSPAKYYVRRETINGTTGQTSVVIENLDGTVPSPTPTGLMPITATQGTAAASVTVESTFFDVVTADTGYAVTDILARVLFVNTATSAVTSSWQNLTQGATLTGTPNPANILEQTRNIAVTSAVLAPGAATSGLQTAGNTLLSQLHADLLGPTTPVARVSSTASLTNTGDGAVLSVDGYNTLAMQLSQGQGNTWGGSVAVFGSMDGGASYPVIVNMLSWSGGAAVSSFGASGNWECACGGLTHVKVMATAAITNGPVTALLVATEGLKSLRVGNPAGNPLIVKTAVSVGQDYSRNVPTIATQLGFGNMLVGTVPADVTRQGGFFFQSQKASSTLLFFDDGTSAATDGSDPSRTCFVIDGPATTGNQGGSLGSQDLGLHQGRIRVLAGSISAQYALRVW